MDLPKLQMHGETTSNSRYPYMFYDKSIEHSCPNPYSRNETQQNTSLLKSSYDVTHPNLTSLQLGTDSNTQNSSHTHNGTLANHSHYPYSQIYQNVYLHTHYNQYNYDSEYPDLCQWPYSTAAHSYGYNNHYHNYNMDDGYTGNVFFLFFMKTLTL